MAYEVEDEVDWSDGTLDENPSTSTGLGKDSGYVSPVVHENDNLAYLFKSEDEAGLALPRGVAPTPARDHPTVTRAQRARIGVHLNRRQPSEQDYAHFALYQANQKAYEATFLKHFVNHALQPSQIEQCFQDGTDARSKIQQYIASISANVNDISKKMIWNAHCRTVNLLANAGKDGAPFWDVGTFDRAIFSSFNPSNATLVSHKMKESWHLFAPNPSMVRYTTKDYFIGHHSSPFEEIDGVAATLFRSEAFESSMPTGRIIKHPTKKKAKGQGLPGASVRKPIKFTPRDNWLASLVPPIAVQQYREPSLTAPDLVEASGDIASFVEPRLLDDLRQLQDEPIVRNDLTAEVSPVESLQPIFDLPSADPTQLEQLFEQFGADALSGDHPPDHIAPSQEQVDRVITWPVRLLKDHQRRLTQRLPHVFRQALPGIRAVMTECFSQGFRPVNPDFEELIVDIESREQSKTVPTGVHEQNIGVIENKADAEQEKPDFVYCQKRKREQPIPIRMFNKPVEQSKKKRKIDEGKFNLHMSEAVARPRKQKVITSTRLSFTPKTTKPKTRTGSSLATTAPSSPTLLPPHSSGSKILEPHQHLPPSAYFSARSPGETPVWRCGIKHALGHYYNAGDRKNCPGCFTALSDNTKAIKMDFYLPSRTYYHQLNPTSFWRPSKPFGATYGRARRSKHLSHNSIAKEAYWASIDSGADTDSARQAALDAVLASLLPKPPRKKPSPAPPPTPEPDPGPHPSGSATMEPSQDLPSCAYFTQRARHEQFAWRCDVNHALGRYYLAGGKRSCPGCGSHAGGLGKHAIMDFYLPPGVIVRQDMADGTARWKPRQPYKMRAGGEGSAKKEKKAESTHNQLASRYYWAAIDAGKSAELALVSALQATDTWLDERAENAVRRAEERDTARQSKDKSKGEASTATASTALNAARMRDRHLPSDSDDIDDVERDETDDEMHDAALEALAALADESSSSDSSLGSDSE